MAALPNIGGALCSTPQSLADPTTGVSCSNAAKTRNQLKLAGVLQTTGPIPFMCDCDAALCQITLTTCYNLSCVCLPTLPTRQTSRRPQTGRRARRQCRNVPACLQWSDGPGSVERCAGLASGRTCRSPAPCRWTVIITFCVDDAKMRQNVLWSRASVSLCVCVSVCLSAAVRPHYCTDPDVTWGRGRGCPLVVQYWADLQSVHGLRCYSNIA